MSLANAKPAPVVDERSPYPVWIQSAKWDLFWIFPSLWLSALIALLELVPKGTVIILTLLAGERIVALTHSWSTTYMVLGSPLFKAQRKNNPLRFVLLPLAIFAVSMVLGLLLAKYHRFPLKSGMDPTSLLLVVYIGSFYVGHFWHFGRQDFGVLSLYRSRAHQTRPLDREIDHWYSLILMYVIQPIVFFRTISTTLFSGIFFHLFPVDSLWIEKLAEGGVVLTQLLCALVVLWELRKPNYSRPKTLYYCVMAAHPLLLYYGPEGFGIYYSIAYLWSHWFIATALVSRIHFNYQRSLGVEKWRAVAHHVLILGAVIGSVWAMTTRYTHFHILSMETERYPAFLESLTQTKWWFAGIFMGYFLGEQLVHYYCDRCLFRFKDPETRKAVLPFL
jgi:hypothetical protein